MKAILTDTNLNNLMKIAIEGPHELFLVNVWSAIKTTFWVQTHPIQTAE